MSQKLKKNKRVLKVKKSAYNFSHKLILIFALVLAVFFLLIVIRKEQAKGKIDATDQVETVDGIEQVGEMEPEDIAQLEAPDEIDSEVDDPEIANLLDIQSLQSSGAFLAFNPSTRAAYVGKEFTVKLYINTKGSQVLSSDAYVIYNGKHLKLISIKGGSFFPVTNSSSSSNSLVVRGMVNEPAAFRVGKGRIATIKFKALRKGKSKLNFYCNLQAGDTSKIIENHIDAQNVIDCSSNQEATIKVYTRKVTPTVTPKHNTMKLTPTVKPNWTNKLNDSTVRTVLAFFLVLFTIVIIVAGV